MSYSSEVLADSPQAYYRLGESSGTTMVDQVAARNGVYTNVTLGTTGLLTGDADTAASFNGSSSDGTVAYASWMNVSTAFSTTALITPTGVSGTQAIADRDAATGRAYLWRLNGNKLEFITSSGTVGIVFATGTTVLVAGTTYHVAATFDGSNIRTYINGAIEKTQAASGSMNTGSTSPLTIGASYAGSGSLTSRFTGVIDEVTYYNTVLSAARISAHYAAATGAASPDATVAPPAATATAAARVPVVSAASSVSPPGAAATASALPPTIGAGGNATVSPPAATATATAIAPTITQVIPAGTDTSNSLNGRRRRARAAVVVTRPAGATPSRAAVKYDKSVPYPPPTLVNGRPT